MVDRQWIRSPPATRAPRCFASVSRCEQSRAPGGILPSAVEWPGAALAVPHRKARSATCYSWTNPCIPRVASNSMSRPWTKRRASDRKRVPRETLERTITVAVKNSDRQCEPFVGVVIEHLAPKSPEDANWAIKGIRFGRAERAKCSAALTIVVNKMRGKFELQQEEVGP
jgi:hypothetical protein